MYCMDYHGRVPAYLEGLALRNQSRYDLFFLCEDDIPYDDTWDRSGPRKRAVFHAQIVADLLDRRIPYIPLTGSLQERIAKVDAVLARFRKYGNFFGGAATE
jgi:HTH-type transcriptional repressor of NAD biosynthesis genes